MIWYLVFWSITVPPFEGGQYQSRERCEAAAVVQKLALYETYGRLKWICETRTAG